MKKANDLFCNTLDFIVGYTKYLYEITCKSKIVNLRKLGLEKPSSQ